MAKAIRPDGTVIVGLDGLQIPVPVPPLAAAILRQVDGRRSVGAIGAILGASGTNPDTFARAWRGTYTALERVNRLLLAAPLSA